MPNRNEKVTTTITVEGLTPAQAAALERTFRHMVDLGKMGASRWVCFFADGDGNYHPKVTVSHSEEQELIAKFSAPQEYDWVKPDDYEEMIMIDFDNIAWAMNPEAQ